MVGCFSHFAWSLLFHTTYIYLYIYMYIEGYLIEISTFKFYDLYVYFSLSVWIYTHATKEEENKIKKKKKEKKEEKNEEIEIYHSIVRKACMKSQIEQHKGQMATLYAFFSLSFFFLSVWIIIWEDIISFFALMCRSILKYTLFLIFSFPRTSALFLFCILPFYHSLSRARSYFYCIFSSFTLHGKWLFTSMVHDSFAWIWSSQYR